MTQSRIMSLVEAATNVIVGYVLAILTQLAVFPLFGLEAALREHLAIGIAFVGVSLIRGYALRRLFERYRLPKLQKPATALTTRRQSTQGCRVFPGWFMWRS